MSCHKEPLQSESNYETETTSHRRFFLNQFSIAKGPFEGINVLYDDDDVNVICDAEKNLLDVL